MFILAPTMMIKIDSDNNILMTLLLMPREFAKNEIF